MRCGLYIRCSTKDQTTDNQRDDLLAYVKNRGFTVVEVFDDKGHSGAKDDRPALTKMMESVRMRKLDAVVVWKLDRLARSVRHTVNTVCELENYGVRFISVQDQIDLSTPYGRFMFQVFSAFSELEREIIKERCARGRLKAVESGKYLGRPKSINYRKVMDLYSLGKSNREIAKVLSISKSSVHKIISKEKTG